MNEPVETFISDQDIINEYEKTKDKRATARRYCIKVADVTAIVKRKSKRFRSPAHGEKRGKMPRFVQKRKQKQHRQPSVIKQSGKRQDQYERIFYFDF